MWGKFGMITIPSLKKHLSELGFIGLGAIIGLLLSPY